MAQLSGALFMANRFPWEAVEIQLAFTWSELLAQHPVERDCVCLCYKMDKHNACCGNEWKCEGSNTVPRDKDFTPKAQRWCKVLGSWVEPKSAPTASSWGSRSHCRVVNLDLFRCVLAQVKREDWGCPNPSLTEMRGPPQSDWSDLYALSCAEECHWFVNVKQAPSSPHTNLSEFLPLTRSSAPAAARADLEPLTVRALMSHTGHGWSGNVKGDWRSKFP